MARERENKHLPLHLPVIERGTKPHHRRNAYEKRICTRTHERVSSTPSHSQQSQWRRLTQSLPSAPTLTLRPIDTARERENEHLPLHLPAIERGNNTRHALHVRNGGEGGKLTQNSRPYPSFSFLPHGLREHKVHLFLFATSFVSSNQPMQVENFSHSGEPSRGAPPASTFRAVLTVTRFTTVPRSSNRKLSKSLLAGFAVNAALQIGPNPAKLNQLSHSAPCLARHLHQTRLSVTLELEPKGFRSAIIVQRFCRFGKVSALTC